LIRHQQGYLSSSVWYLPP